MTFTVGDGILTGALSQGNVTRLIKLGAAVGQYQTPDEKWHRYPPEARHFSHIALVIGEDGTVAEAVKRGVRKAHVSKYDPLDCLHLRMGVEDERDRAQIRLRRERHRRALRLRLRLVRGVRRQLPAQPLQAPADRLRRRAHEDVLGLLRRRARPGGRDVVEAGGGRHAGRRRRPVRRSPLRRRVVAAERG
jgi:hypothetical protein